MRKRIIILSCLLAVAGAWLLWPRAAAPSPKPVAKVAAPVVVAAPPVAATNQAVALVAGSLAVPTTNRFPFRLTNTPQTIGQLLTNRHAILLANALIDVEVKAALAIPQHLQHSGEPGAFIVQARGLIGASFRAALAAAGGQIVSYIPNNAYLVQLTSAGAAALAGNPLVQAVLPYEPYYKIQSTLLGQAVNSQPLAAGTYLTLGLYGSSAADTEARILALGGQIVGRDRSPFGTIVRVQPPADWLALAQLPGVQIVEPAHQRGLANDLTRVTIGQSPTTTSSYTQDYLGLTGKNVIVEVNDTGVDTNHPDLSGRILWDYSVSGYDTSGHGTHVAGIIAGDGTKSTTVNYAQGSTNPVVANQFRGKANAATIFSVGGIKGGHDTTNASDSYFQEMPAKTNALISNNSWVNFGDYEYDLSAASFDAAVRDALPEVTGSQPVLFVFAAGNDGGGNSSGLGGYADTIASPGTAKNVITVGALEQNRNITNNYTGIYGNTNYQWQPMTDTATEVAYYSARGNVGVGTEGTYGRFKPDVVAPGSFVVSTRSLSTATVAYDLTNTYYYNPDFGDSFVDSNNVAWFQLPVPYNTVGLKVTISRNTYYSPIILPTFQLYFSTNTHPIPGSPTTYFTNVIFTNGNGGSYTIPPTNLPSLRSSGTLFVTVSNTANYGVEFNLLETILVTNSTSYFLARSNLDNSLTPYYLYDTGTSMAAPAVSGMLALMQDYFTNQLHLLPSPALLKAMVINGAREDGNYGYAVNVGPNYEGWGLINLSNSLPASLGSSTASLFFADQNPTNVLKTGDSWTYRVNVQGVSTNQPLRITLAWTDPPGNPVSAVKLVNHLGLIVTNLTTGRIYYGNNFEAGMHPPYTTLSQTNDAPAWDAVNNVQSIVIAPSSAANYAVTVIGRSVNVNAVTTEPTNIVQDYALVIASDDAGNTSGVSVTPPVPASASVPPQVTYVSGSLGYYNKQYIGSGAPLLNTNFINFPANSGYATNAVLYIGQTNQWHFYVMTNTTSFTNAAFVIFQPNTLSIPREGVFAGYFNNATLPEANLDLYVAVAGVTNDPNAASLTNLNPAVISNCVSGQFGDSANLARGGTKFVVLSNAVQNQVFYIGVKCEDQTAAQYAFLGAFSLNPFSGLDANGNEFVNGIIVTNNSDGSNWQPGAGMVLGLAQYPMTLRNVIVTNVFNTQNFGDLLGFLTHDAADNLSTSNNYATLNNHNGTWGPGSFTLVYSDSPSNGVVGSINSDGPGTLENFAGTQGAGVWQLTEIDDALNQNSSVSAMTLFLQPHQTNSTLKLVKVTIPASGWFFDFISVPGGCTNLTVVATNLSGSTPSPLMLALQYDTFPYGPNNWLNMVYLTGSPYPGGAISYGPPLPPGIYWVGIYNPNLTDATDVVWGYSLGISPASLLTADYVSTDTPLPIADDAITVSPTAMTTYGFTNSTIFVSDFIDLVVGFSVGLRVDHPRISDLVFTLIDPYGDRYLLMENRGGTSTNGCGTTGSGALTNFPIVSGAGVFNNLVNTQTIDTGTNSGFITIYYDTSGTNTIDVYYQGTNIWHTNANYAHIVTSPNINYGPGTSTYVSIVINQGGASDINAVWQYVVASRQAQYSYLAFTEDASLTTTPIKFAPVPFVPNPAGTLTNLYYQAEQSLAPLTGNSFMGSYYSDNFFFGNYAFGEWQLEVLDNRAGATNPAPQLVSWRLEFKYATNYVANTYPLLRGFNSQSNTVAANSIQWYQINVPSAPKPASYATNILKSSSAPVNLWFSLNYPPTLDTLLLTNSTGNTNSPIILSTNTASTPFIVPGNTYYLGVQNTQSLVATNIIEVDFDHGNPYPGPSSLQFSSAQTSDSQAQLSWSPGPGSHYQIQWKDNLSDPWNTITNPPMTIINGVATFTDTDPSLTAPLGKQRFYRLVWVD